MKPLKTLLIIIFLFSFSVSYSQDIVSGSPKTSNGKPVIEKEVYEVETESITEADESMADFMRERFPIISDKAVDEIIKTRFSMPKYTLNPETKDSTLTYNVTYKVSQNYLADTAKILWELNIPEFKSRLYQLFKQDTVYLDTWNNVVGANGTKTYTGHFEAYRIRNWPSWKDPDKGKEHLAPTPPGPKNPLGLFVVHYDENSLRYFHGTNKNDLVYSKMRNLSHGCVRNDNDNIAKMKEFIIKRVVKSQDLSAWLGSKKSLIYNFEEQDKFPVRIIYKTFDINADENGHYIEFFKDVYNYSNPKSINTKLNDPSLIVLSTPENIKAEFVREYNKGLNEQQLDMVINYLLGNAAEYERYYFEDLRAKFLITD
jgi:lipoprotein-anchoring transpeptidase ErfK/SrfK